MTQELSPDQQATAERFGIFEADVLDAMEADMAHTGPSFALGPIRAPRSVLEDTYEFLRPETGVQQNAHSTVKALNDAIGATDD